MVCGYSLDARTFIRHSKGLTKKTPLAGGCAGAESLFPSRGGRARDLPPPPPPGGGYFKSHISLWEHSSHFRLIGRGVPSVSVVSQLMYEFLCLASPKENP